MISSGNTFKRLKNISVPTLIVHGKKDLILPPKNAEILVEQIPEAKILYLEKSAHLIFSVETEFLVRELISFLS
jgi:pimeloyl-ACP methyl ester carboxylesterase